MAETPHPAGTSGQTPEPPRPPQSPQPLQADQAAPTGAGGAPGERPQQPATPGASATAPARRRRWLTAVVNRWPTALALAASALTFGGGGDPDGEVMALGNVLLLLPLMYLMVAKLERRRATWPLLAVGFVLVVALRMLDVIAPAAVFAAIALVVLVWAAFDGQLFRSGTFQVQAVGMLVFGALGLVGLAVDPDLGRYLVAAGWFFHGVWDLVHIRLNRVVARSFAEWCAVFDLVIAAQLVLAV